MKTLILIAVCALVVRQSWAYCYVGAPDNSHADKCALANGTLVEIGETVTFPEKCESCTCTSWTGKGAVLSCCGYGIHAGVFAPAPGCKVTTEADGCTVKLVRIDDETQLC